MISTKSRVLAHANPALVEVMRGPLVESRHRCAVAVVDSHVGLVRKWGDIEAVILPRSSLKPFQAISMLESGAFDAFGLADEELALHCASHSGESEHVSRVVSWLAKIGCGEDDLKCGPQRPLGLQLEPNLPEQHPQPSKVANNCSGKHTGFLTTAKHLGAGIRGYTSTGHPVQQLVRNIIAEMCDTDPESMPVGFDNCGAPVFGVSLHSFAHAAARLAKPDGLESVRADACTRVVSAMRAHPWLVAGSRRADTILMQDDGFDGVAKCGAEGVFLVAVPEEGIGMAIKVDDGGDRAASALAVGVLHALGILDVDTHSRLSAAIDKTVMGADGDEVISTVRVIGEVLAV